MTYGSAYVIGRGIFGPPPTGARAWLMTGGIAVTAFMVDSRVFGLRTPMWARQTPRHLFFRYGPAVGALLWGLDTGAVVTTFRVSSLSWAALSLAVLGLAPWWSGIAYGLGFILPLWFVTLVARPANGGSQISPEPVWMVQLLTDFVGTMRGVALGVLGSMAIASILAALLVANRVHG